VSDDTLNSFGYAPNAHEDTIFTTQLNAVSNAYASSRTLHILAASEFHNIRRIVARHPNADQETLQYLANDADYDVQYEVVMNPKASAHTLDWIAKHTNDWSIREKLAMNRRTPIPALIHMAKLKDSILIDMLINNPNTPELVKLWLKNPDFAGLTLDEFLKNAQWMF
jgi:hypothetical protein